MEFGEEDLAARLPPHFVIGVATAAFQIEGAVNDDGRGLSGWDLFSTRSGTILNGDSPAVACDHYHRAADDVAMMRELGIDSYRLSLSWPRIQPEGSGAVNRQGLDFYDRLIDLLLDAGIQPAVTLYHWDTPLPLDEAGGWMRRETAERFGEFASIAGRALGDRVPRWITLNEPATVTLNGYGLGIHAPGQARLFDALPAAHHQLLGHGLAVQALRSSGARGEIGITNVHSPVVPANRSLSTTIFAELFDVLHNRIFGDPVLLGSYPQVADFLAPLFGVLLETPAADMEIIHQPLDFYGLNYYAPTKIAAGPGEDNIIPGEPPEAAAKTISDLPFRIEPWPDHATTRFGWPVAPEYFKTVLADLAAVYGEDLPPVYITENGASFDDVLSVDPGTGRASVHDQDRITYLRDHLRSALDAVAEGGEAAGVDLRGFYVWTLMDNFEWAAGYSQRFGLVHTDFNTLARTPKDSFYWLQDLQRSRATARAATTATARSAVTADRSGLPA